MASLNVLQKKDHGPRLVELTPDKSYVMPWARAAARFRVFRVPRLVYVSRTNGRGSRRINARG